MPLRSIALPLALMLSVAPALAQVASPTPAPAVPTEPRETIEGTLSQDRTVIAVPAFATPAVTTVAGLLVSVSPLLLLCEHAGNLVPAPWMNLGLPPEFLETHYGYDPGVDGLTRALSQRLNAPAVLARYSRLFLDYNRFASDWDHMRPDLGGIPVPGNLRLRDEDVALRRSIALEPLDEAIAALAAGRSAVVSVHYAGRAKGARCGARPSDRRQRALRLALRSRL